MKCITAVNKLADIYKGETVIGDYFATKVREYYYRNNIFPAPSITSIRRRMRESGRFVYLSPNHEHNPKHNRSMFKILGGHYE